MSFNEVLNQVFQPYFYYSVMFLVVSFACIKVFNRFCHFITPKTKSLLYLIPLAVPLLVMAVYLPKLTLEITPSLVSSGTVMTSFNSGAATGLFVNSADVIVITASSLPTVFSVTGLMCIFGLVAADIFVVVMVLADDRLARRFLHVISISADEYASLQRSVADLSQKMRIAAPKIGLVEDLRPNAYTIGYGKRATVVFSMGLLNILNEEEVTAVASHELAHLKNRDFFYKLLSSTLTVISFFNPVAYLASSAGQREREMLADQEGVKAAGAPNALSSALAKICKSLATLPRQNFLVSASSNLLVTSSVLHRFGLLSTHPRLDTRLRNISTPNPDRLNPRKLRSAVLLSLLLVSVACMAVYGVADLQTTYAGQVQPVAFKYQSSMSSAIDSSATSNDATGGFTGVFNSPVNLTTSSSAVSVNVADDLNNTVASGSLTASPSVSKLNAAYVVTPYYLVPVSSGIFKVSSP
jgi:heat shock protein HtpX